MNLCCFLIDDLMCGTICNVMFINNFNIIGNVLVKVYTDNVNCELTIHISCLFIYHMFIDKHFVLNELGYTAIQITIILL